jgi:RNase P subunit RPR2
MASWPEESNVPLQELYPRSGGGLMAEFTLPGQHLPLLGTLWPGDRNAFSPLTEFGTPEERARVKEILASSAVMEPHGEIDVRFHHVMSVLDDPERYVSLDVIPSGDMNSLETYYSTDKVSAVSLISGESGNVKVRENTGLQDFFTPEDFDTIPNYELTTADVRMSIPEARTAAAIFDGERRSAYAAVLQAANSTEMILEPSVHDPASIQALFASSGLDPENNFFLNLLDGMGGMDRAEVNPAGMEQHLQSLQAKGIIRRSGSGYTIPEQMLPMIRRTLVFERMMIVRTGRKDGSGRTVSESALCIRADGTLLWFIRPDQTLNEILLKYVSSAMESDILHQLIENPLYSLAQLTVPLSVQPTGSAAPVNSVQPESSREHNIAKGEEKNLVCHSCHAPMAPGKKFCGKCGATASYAPVQSVPLSEKMCPDCGAPVVPGKKFCGKCGAKINMI